ncbi:MAG: hypothetical protein HY000_03240 [Planctomycetes bacterium]|nr:hypothetical protein [Planctomycetota bacterium]
MPPRVPGADRVEGMANPPPCREAGDRVAGRAVTAERLALGRLICGREKERELRPGAPPPDRTAGRDVERAPPPLERTPPKLPLILAPPPNPPPPPPTRPPPPNPPPPRPGNDQAWSLISRTTRLAPATMRIAVFIEILRSSGTSGVTPAR